MRVARQGAGATVAWASAGLGAWLDAERGRFPLWLPVFMAAGVLAYFQLRVEPPWWAAQPALVIGLAGCVLARRHMVVRAVALCLLAASIGFASAQLASWRAPPPVVMPNRAAIVTGTVRGIDLLPQGGRRVLLAGARLSPDEPVLPRHLRIRLRDADGAVLTAGDGIRLRAMLRDPPPPAYPGAWDTQRDAYFSGLGGSGWAIGPVEVLRHAGAGGVTRWWRGLRERVNARFVAGLPGPAGAVAGTLFTGEQTAIPPSDRAAFRDSGLAHLLAVAGLHVGIVMGVCFGVTRLGLTAGEWAALHLPCKQIAAVTALVGGGVYLLLTGGHVPILRSFAMACVVLLGLLTGRRAVSLRALAVAATALMLLAPQEVPGVSFGMSFAAVAALIAGYEALRPALDRLRGDGHPARRLALHGTGLALTSLLAGTASLPYAAYHFGHVQLFFVLANMAAVPITAMLVMPAGLAALALMPFGLEWIALAPMGWGIEAILAIGRHVSAWPAATLAVPHPAPWVLGLVSLSLAWLCLWRSRMRWLAVPGLAAAVMAVVATRPPDVLMSANARLIAIRSPAGMMLERQPGASDFTLESWRATWTGGTVTDFPGSGAGPGYDCTTGGCRLLDRVLLLRHGDQPMADCATAAVLLAAEPLRQPCSAQAAVVDRFTVWRDGAHALRIGEGGVTILSDRAERGTRPWVVLPPERRARAYGLPMAPVDPLPPE